MIHRLSAWNSLIFLFYLFFVTVLVSLYQYLNLLDNKCLMTFMYETPNFIPVPMPRKLEENFKKYKIYAYKEGKADNRFSYSDFNGFPVIFIPGSSGSYKQVRSFASLSMNFHRHYATRSHLDFFSIDFSEELSGVYGAVLNNQTIFLNQAIKVIKRIYYKRNQNNHNSENRLIIIAHSFAGMVFKGLINLPSFQLEDIFLFLTLATPHRRSVFPFDTAFYNYYTQIDDILHHDLSIYSKYQNMSKISIGGGLNDNLVRSDLTNAKELNQWSLTSNALPEVWVPADHKCIVWCRQLIKKLVHLIFDLLEEQHNDPRLLNKNLIIEHHLNYRFNDRLTPRYRMKSSLVANEIQKAKIFNINKRLLILEKSKIMDTLVYQFKFIRNTILSIISTNLHKSDWIFVCRNKFASGDLNHQTNDSHPDDQCVNAANYSNQPIPSINEFVSGVRRNHFILDSNFYLDQDYSTLALKLSPSIIRTAFQFERIIVGRRDKTIDLPNIFHRFMWLFNPFKTILKKNIGEESTFYNLSLNSFDQIWHNYNLRLEIGKCYSQAKEETIIQIHVPWYREDRFFAIETKKDTFFNAVLNLNVPKYDETDERKIQLRLLLDPFCEYRLKIKFSLRETIIQLFRHYAFLFLPIATSIFLNLYSIQMIADPDENANQPIENQLIQKNNHYFTLKSILMYRLEEMTWFGIQPISSYIIYVCLNRFANMIMTIDNYQNQKLSSIRYTRHNSPIDSLIVCYLIYTFIYSIIFISTHLFAHLFNQLINLNEFIYLNFDQLQYKLRLSSFYTKYYSNYNSRINRRLFFILTFMLSLYLKLFILVLVVYYLVKLLHLSTQSTLNQHKIGLTKSTTRFYLELSRFFMTLIAFIPLIPKFIVWYTNDEFELDEATIFFTIHFVFSLIQLHFESDQQDSTQTSNRKLSYFLKFLSLICLCLAHLDYTVITISITISLIIHSILQITITRRNDEQNKKNS